MSWQYKWLTSLHRKILRLTDSNQRLSPRLISPVIGGFVNAVHRDILRYVRIDLFRHVGHSVSSDSPSCSVLSLIFLIAIFVEICSKD